jgi:hypothetical protein
MLSSYREVRQPLKVLVTMFGFGRASKDELESLRAACKPNITAFAGCTKANPGSEKLCVNLEIGVLTCLAGRKACAAERKAFDQCSIASHATSTTSGRFRVYADAKSCVKQIEAMRKCLLGKGIWPEVASKQ